ncbi:unnamed protein product [Musa acuminata subsp. burmannicoides]
MTTPRTSNKIDDSNPGSSRHLGRADHLSKSKNMGASTNPFYYLCSCPTLPLHDSSHSDSSIDGLRITTGDDRDYSRKLVSHARQVHVFMQLFDLAKNHRGLYQNSVPPAGQFYSCSGDDVSPS